MNSSKIVFRVGNLRDAFIAMTVSEDNLCIYCYLYNYIVTVKLDLLYCDTAHFTQEQQ